MKEEMAETHGKKQKRRMETGQELLNAFLKMEREIGKYDDGRVILDQQKQRFEEERLRIEDSGELWSKPILESNTTVPISIYVCS